MTHSLHTGIFRIAALAVGLLAPASAQALDANNQFICTLVGAGAHNGTNPTSNHQPDLQLYGTDLGLSFRHRHRLVMLFGDTWVQDNAICSAPPSDDSVGAMFLGLDNDPDDCLDLRFRKDAGNGARPIRVLKNGVQLPMGALRTPITGWSDNRRAYGYFSGNNTVQCGPGNACPSDLACGASNVCVDPTSSMPAAAAAERHISRTPGPLGLTLNFYTVRHTFVTGKFLNATARTVKAFNENNPGANNYTAPNAGFGLSTGELLMWGRPGFAATAGTTADLYLLHHPLPGLQGPSGPTSWQPRYFAGLKAGQPTWSDDQAEAVPVIEDEAIGQVLQHSIAWVPSLNQFVMLYGGRLPFPFTLVPNDPNAGIRLRTAPHPWGPWSDPQLIWNATAESAYGGCPNGVLYPPLGGGCAQTDPFRPGGLKMCPAPSPNPNLDFGVEYGVNILSTFTKPGPEPNSATIYWNISTWNPYRVVLMKTTLTMP